MSSNPDYDRWYAAQHVRILRAPSHRLETFGNTLVNYHLVTELPDNPGKVRVREGRFEAHKPLVLTPHFADFETEGLGPAARQYLSWLRDNEENMRILRYGFKLRSDNFSEQVVTDSLQAVVARVMGEVAAAHDDFAAVLTGEDEPWDIALVELWRHEVDRSAKFNFKELQDKGKLF